MRESMQLAVTLTGVLIIGGSCRSSEPPSSSDETTEGDGEGDGDGDTAGDGDGDGDGDPSGDGDGDPSGDGDGDPTGDGDGDPSCEEGAPGLGHLQFSPALFGEGDDPSASPSCGLRNPERGLHAYVDMRSASASTFEGVFDDGLRLVYGKFLIDDYRDQPLDQSLLDEVESAFALARAAGVKVIPRFHYSDAGDEPDASLAMILTHIDQLAPIFAANEDAIALMQAGFIGAWGEWHSSQNGLDNPSDRLEILDALLAAVPASRMIEVRRPSFKQDAYAGPVDSSGAFEPTGLGRIGHVNDCFLASDSDEGTYQEPGEKDYVIADSAYVAVGGETCAVNPPRSDCPTALDELEAIHWTHLNRDYHPDVLDAWGDQGCFDTVTCRLGYRFALRELSWTQTAAAGGAVDLGFVVRNDGFARSINSRPVYLALTGPEQVMIPLGVDAREWAPGVDSDVCVQVLLPADLQPGVYQVGLWLPDASASLADRAEYAVALAGDASWDASAGINGFDAQLTVE